METNNLIIMPPEGMEWYQEGNEIKFRPIKKGLTYEDITRELFGGKDVWRIEGYNIVKYNKLSTWDCIINCTSKKQVQRLLAINKLMNVAKYLNDGWQPNWGTDELNYFIYVDSRGVLSIGSYVFTYSSDIYFKSSKLAQQAIEILGEETIKLALLTDW